MKYPIKQQGFTLLEVMVAVGVFSFGLIGIILLQSYALQYNQAAFDKVLLATASNSFMDDLNVSLKDRGNTATTQAAITNRTINNSGLSAESTNLQPSFPAKGAGEYQTDPAPIVTNSGIVLNISSSKGAVATEQRLQALEAKKGIVPVVEKRVNFQKLL